MEGRIKSFESFAEAQKAQWQFLFRKNRAWLHVLFWVVASLSVVVNGVVTARFGRDLFMEEDLGAWGLEYSMNDILISLVIAGILNYIFLLWVVPYSRYKVQRRYVWIFVLAELLIYLMIAFILGILAGFFDRDQYFVTFNAMLSLIFGLQLSFLSFYYFWDIYDKQSTLTSYQEVLEQRVEAESNFLNAQVNPHFLFNTLNNIYSLTFNDIKEAKLSIEKMLSLISYIHDESGSNWIDLNTEIEFLKSYLNLELLRNKENNVRLIFEVDGDLNGKRIAPLILINFIENAFKHGVKSNLQKSYINIRIDVYEQNIVFVIRNKKGEKHHELDKQIGGIGLKNVKRRLELIYPRNYDLKIKDKKGYYEVKLVLGNNKW